MLKESEWRFQAGRAGNTPNILPSCWALVGDAVFPETRCQDIREESKEQNINITLHICSNEHNIQNCLEYRLSFIAAGISINSAYITYTQH